jgi:ATP phosphoribosyltransferase regulatory subunit
MTLYPDAVRRAAGPAPRRPRLFLPLGADRQAAAAARAAGYATVAALSAQDDPRALGCTHVLRGTTPAPIEE